MSHTDPTSSTRARYGQTVGLDANMNPAPMKDQPIDQLQPRPNRQFDPHGRRMPAHDAPMAASASASTTVGHQPTGSRDRRKRPAGEDLDSRGRAQGHQVASSIEYNPNLVKRQRRESPPPATNGDYYNGRGSLRSSTDLDPGQGHRSGHGNNGRRGSEREWGSPTRATHRGGRGGVRNDGANMRHELPPAPRDPGRDRDNRPERSGYQGQQQQHQPRRDHSNKADQSRPPPPRINSSASASASSSSAAAGPSSSAPRIDPQRLPLPLLPSRPSQGPAGSAAAPLPPKPAETDARQLPFRSARSPSASSASYTVFSESDDDDVVETTRTPDRSPTTFSSLFNEDDGIPSPRVELQYNPARLSASSSSASTQFNSRSSTASGPAAAPPLMPPARSMSAATSGADPPPPPTRARALTASSTTGAASSRAGSAIAFPEINYPSYSAASGNASTPASGSRRASIDDDNAPNAQLMTAMSAQHHRYLDLSTKLGELDDQSSDLDKQISDLIAAKKEVDAKRRDLMHQLRTALDDDPIATAGPPEMPPPPRSAAPTPPAVPRQTTSGPIARAAATGSSSSLSRSGPPAPGAGSASGANAAPSPLTVTRTAMTDKITTRKPRALAYHPQLESDLVVAAFMDRGIRFFDTSRRSCTLLQHCPIASADPANPGDPESSPRIETMRFVGSNHLVAIHLKNDDDVQMSMITVDRQANGTRALSTKHHHFGISLYDRGTSAVASDRDPATYRFATAGKSEADGWRVHLWSLRQPIVAADDDGRYPHVLRPTDHFQTFDVPATHTSHIHSMILEDNNLFTSGFDGRLQWIDLTAQQPKWKTQLRGKKVTQILNSPTDPHLLYVACADSSAQFRVIDRRLVGSHAEPVSQVQFGYNTGDTNLSSTLVSAVDPHTGMHFVSGSSLSDQKGTVLSWDLRFISSRPRATYYEPTEQMQLGHSGRVDVVQFSPHSHSMATLGGDYRLGLHSLA